MRKLAVSAAMTSALIATAVAAKEPTSTNADAWQRAAATEKKMTDTERVVMTSGITALPNAGEKIPEDAVLGAGYVAGIPRLGVPALKETDAGLGVSWALGARGNEGATALPSGMALAATWNQELAYQAGQMVGAETRAKGFNVLLAGGVNLVRDPRGGRNFEYFSEDPLLSGILGGYSIAGAQSNHIISTVKHFAFNNQETARKFGNVTISEAAARESELLAFKLAIEIGNPGSVMCSYNRLNGPYTCGSEWLLQKVLKRDWGYKGFVMSDWGAVYEPGFAWAGLDHQSGRSSDPQVYFADQLLTDAGTDAKRKSRISDMNRRILWAVYSNGLDRFPVLPGEKIDKAGHEALAGEVARQGIVLLRNERGALPLAAGAKSIAVIGGFADTGMLSGGGSSQVHGDGGPAAMIPGGGRGLFNGWEQYQRGTTPLAAIRKRAGQDVTVTYRTGNYIAEAVEQARKADVAIVFANQWQSEGRDNPDLSLPRGQDALIAAVAAANPNTVVVLQTGSAVLMPWLDQTAAVLEAWYPGVQGGEAIASVLFGDTNPSGRLPVTFPASLEQLPHPVLPGHTEADPDKNGAGAPGQQVTIDYNVDGSDVGYRWFARQGHKPLFPFGYGLSYTNFATSGLSVKGGKATVTVQNTGGRAGATVAQVYLVARGKAATRRLVGFQRVSLDAGASKIVTMTIDLRLLADWKDGRWSMPRTTYYFAVGENAEALSSPIGIRLPAKRWAD